MRYFTLLHTLSYSLRYFIAHDYIRFRIIPRIYCIKTITHFTINV